MKDTITIFLSKDRALQLDCALKSFFKNCANVDQTDVLVYYATSDDRHELSYKQLSKDFDIPFIKEINIKEDIISKINDYKYFFISVDDNVFHKPFDIKKIIECLKDDAVLGFTLRLGKNTTYCYPIDSQQILPKFTNIKDNILSFDWRRGHLDFGYAIEISGTFYKTEDFLPMLRETPIKSSHQLEANIAYQTARFSNTRPLTLCYETSVVFSNPLNIAKADVKTNRKSNDIKYSLDNLLELFEEGERIDIDYYSNIEPNAAHYEAGIQLKKTEKKYMSRKRHPNTTKKIEFIKNEPLVSVLVPTYNRKWLLPRTLESVLKESYKNIEIVLVNDAGEDVQDIVNKFNDKRIKYFQNEKNLDLAGTRNVALKHSSGDYICLLDDDDIHLQYTLEFRMYMIKKLNADVVYTRALQDIWEKRPEGYASVHRQLYWDSPFDRDLILIQNIAPCCCPLFSRHAWEETNYKFDETLTTSEDWDFWVHMSRKFDFHELKLVDVECSIRQDNTQMTGSRNGYTTHLPYLYKKWRPLAKNLAFVTEHQNNSLIARGLKPEDYGL